MLFRSVQLLFTFAAQPRHRSLGAGDQLKRVVKGKPNCVRGSKKKDFILGPAKKKRCDPKRDAWDAVTTTKATLQGSLSIHSFRKSRAWDFPHRPGLSTDTRATFRVPKFTTVGGILN